MSPNVFLQLCEKLRATCHVRDTIHVIVEEQVARFLCIIAHNVKIRKVFFSTIGLKKLLATIFMLFILLEEFLQQPSRTVIFSEILCNHRLYPYFKGCIRTIDGTHFCVKVSIADQPKFWRRKDWPTQNVLDTCDFDMRFTYVVFIYRDGTLRQRHKDIKLCFPDET
ncbi:hypothetical protein Ahy_B10g103862 [Arachis hypogaea]|uniref:DUF8040 domain-containing protein n=1 Tax=Arachis hypogaea TaxID=3818 RepID=A0A444X497_ARAHY|nr:hypothetical protein Ahy_B10g103862 [Arachis hypogaea]